MPELDRFLETATAEQKQAVQAVFDIGQGPIVFRIPPDLDDVDGHLHTLVDQLCYVDQFYAPIGGIKGYHQTVLDLIAGQETEQERPSTYYGPRGLDLEERGYACDRAVLWGLEHLPEMAEIYPVGGAGDRFGLRDPETGEDLPIARLQFGHHTLLAGMIRDLAGREYLYEKLFGRKVITPIAMMTSEEKHNDVHIRAICEANNWFGRPKESFCLFTQGMVPVISKEGNWCLDEPLHLVRKPGGHGVLWQVMEDEGVFHWLEVQGRHKAIVRQINNPVAGTDNLLLALAGIGAERHKAFGFAACHRLVGSAQGTIVMVETPHDGTWSYRVSNIEYVQLKAHGIEDAPAAPGSKHSKFPANSNLLYADLRAIRRHLQVRPLPGLLINMKKSAPFTDADGNQTETPAGRLETLMQNIADEITVEHHHRAKNLDHLDLHTFVVHAPQRKTLSATKKQWEEGAPLTDTPEGAYHDTLLNNDELLTLCKIEAASPIHLTYHPALGPLYSVIAQKLRGGQIAAGSELELEIAEADIKNLDLNGSLRILADPLAGSKCTLINMTVQNAGITPSPDNIFWQAKLNRSESLRIEIEGDGEFFAENLTLTGSHTIHVPPSTRVVAKMEEGKLVLDEQPLLQPTWQWNYHVGPDNHIELTLAT